MRKIIVSTLDPGVEVPSLRKFALAAQAWLAHLKVQRTTTQRCANGLGFGRQQEEAGRLESGEAFGSFDQWCRWCRDPLVALGCQDRVARIHELRAADPQRELSAELLVTWWEHHKDEWVSQKTLAEAVREIADPEKRGPQYLRTRLNGFDGTRSAGFVFERFKDPNRPTMPSTYRLTQAAPRG